MKKSILELKNVSLIRGTKQVLSNINWSIKQGEHWVIMGPNGCGKSTMLEVASGYRWPMDGEVHLLGKKLGEVFLPYLRSQFGFVAPWVINRIDYEVPVEDVIASGLDASIGRVDKISSKIKAKIHQHLEFVEASDLLGKTFGRLSSGEKLKVILCRSLINNPRLLILDEPFAHLDLTTRYHCYDFLKKLSKTSNSPAMILVTHHIEDICPFFTHALLMKQGKIKLLGRKNQVLTPEIISKIFHIPKRSLSCLN